MNDKNCACRIVPPPPQGPQGPPGKQGPQGPMGNPGTPGSALGICGLFNTSATPISVNNITQTVLLTDSNQPCTGGFINNDANNPNAIILPANGFYQITYGMICLVEGGNPDIGRDGQLLGFKIYNGTSLFDESSTIIDNTPDNASDLGIPISKTFLYNGMMGEPITIQVSDLINEVPNLTPTYFRPYLTIIRYT
ncbi:hypothetical protein V1503_22100 [Bacillus sp. SCS-151]|uniref:hypothetical protein n=1 Tax=Nanhaiella sioensis TaxID=3115293 RepID=UPI00397A0EE2